MQVNATSIETCLGHIYRHLIIYCAKDGRTVNGSYCDRARMELSPLCYYIYTGRASVDFLRRLMEAKPFMIARKLHKGGSDQEIIKAIQNYLGIVPAM